MVGWETENNGKEMLEQVRISCRGEDYAEK